jgi:hypothetical protein
VIEVQERLLRDSLVSHAQRSGFGPKDLGRGLESYAAYLFVQETGFDELLEGTDIDSFDLAPYILRADDLGVDLVLEDETNKQIIIAQCAYRNPKNEVPEDKARSFFSSLDALRSQDFIERGGEQVQALLANLDQKLHDGYTVGLRFVTNLGVPEGHRVRLAAAAQQKAYEDAGFAVVCEVIDKLALADLEGQIRAMRTGFLDTVEFKLQSSQFISFDSPRHTLMGRVSGNELRNLWKRYGPRLFNLNIRQPMAADRGINKEIRDTANASPAEFFYYNNGVSAICSNFSIDGNMVTAERFQVINGAQTLGSLARASKESPEVYVLFRLTATDETTGGPFTDKVIQYNNTQNPVKVSDFRANDPIQSFLAEEFARYSGKGPVPPLKYQAKRGARPVTGHKTVTSDEFARIRHSYLKGPVESFRKPKEFWNRDTSGGGRYVEAFGVDGLLVDRWPHEEVRQAIFAVTVHERIKVLATDMKKKEKAGVKAAEGAYLFRLARYVLALVAVGLAEQREQDPENGDYGYENLLGRTDVFSSVVEPLVKEARRILLTEYTSRRKVKHEVQPEYNLARDDDTWNSLKSQMQEVIRSGLM